MIGHKQLNIPSLIDTSLIIGHKIPCRICIADNFKMIGHTYASAHKYALIVIPTSPKKHVSL